MTGGGGQELDTHRHGVVGRGSERVWLRRLGFDRRVCWWKAAVLRSVKGCLTGPPEALLRKQVTSWWAALERESERERCGGTNPEQVLPCCLLVLMYCLCCTETLRYILCLPTRSLIYLLGRVCGFTVYFYNMRVYLLALFCCVLWKGQEQLGYRVFVFFPVYWLVLYNLCGALKSARVYKLFKRLFYIFFFFIPHPLALPSKTAWPMIRTCHLGFIFHAEIPSAANISVTWYIRDVFNSKAATWLKSSVLEYTHFWGRVHTHLITQSDCWVQHLIFNKCGCLRSILQSNRSSLNSGVFTA